MTLELVSLTVDLISHLPMVKHNMKISNSKSKPARTTVNRQDKS